MVVVTMYWLKFVQDILEEEWKCNDQAQCPLVTQVVQLHEDDLRAATLLLTQLALDTITESSTKKDDNGREEKMASFRTSKRRTPEKERRDMSPENRIKMYVKEKASRFRCVCETGFPFSLFANRPSIVPSFQKALNHYDSILSEFLKLEMQSEWLSESELESRFERPLKRISDDEMYNACSDLQQLYIHSEDLQAGYYLLWLIKLHTRCELTIPDKTVFQQSTLKEALSSFCSDGGKVLYPTNLIDVLHHTASRFDTSMYWAFLDDKAKSIFWNFTVDQLTMCQTGRVRS